MIPGCEEYEHALELKKSWAADQYFCIGQKANKADFEYLTQIADMGTYNGFIHTHEHPSVSAGIPIGTKLKYQGCHWAYMNFRFETDQGDASPNDVIGNVFIQAIKHRFIDMNWAALKATMWEQTFYIDKFGNKWRLIDDNGTVELIELASKDFCIWDYADKPLVVYENNFEFKEYDRWAKLGQVLKALY